RPRVTRFGHTDIRAHAERGCALRTDTPPSAVAAGFIATGQVEHGYAFVAGERLSPSGREHEHADKCPLNRMCPGFGRTVVGGNLRTFVRPRIPRCKGVGARRSAPSVGSGWRLAAARNSERQSHPRAPPATDAMPVQGRPRVWVYGVAA